MNLSQVIADTYIDALVSKYNLDSKEISGLRNIYYPLFSKEMQETYKIFSNEK